MAQMGRTVNGTTMRGNLPLRGDTLQSPGRGRRLRGGICALLSLLVLAVFLQAGSFSFTVYDDDQYLTGNPRVQSGLSAEGVAWAFTTTHAANWHPLTWLSHMLDVELFGMDPGAHHRVNVAFHAANTLLLFLVLLRMTAAPGRSAFVAALFAVHPLHVESVAWVAERKDLLCAFFWFLALGAYARYAARPVLKRYLPVLLLFALALLSKPMAVTLPFVFLLLDFWPLRRASSSAGILRLLPEKIPLFALTAASCAVTLVAQQQGGALAPLRALAPGVRLAHALVAYAAYLGKTLWPASLAVFYPHPGIAPPAWKVAGAILLLAALSALAVWRRDRSPWILTGWLWFLGTLVPVIGLVQVGEQAIADRYTYLPLVGIFLALAWELPEIARRCNLPGRALQAGAVLVLLPLAVASWVQTGYWKNGETLFQHALEVTENNWMAQGNLGWTLTEQGRLAEAIPHYVEALQTHPAFAPAHNNLGVTLGRLGRFGEAEAQFRQALLLAPRFADAHTNLGVVLRQRGAVDEAISQYREALRIRPDAAIAHFNLGNALAQQGKVEEAVRHYLEALKHRPDDPAILRQFEKTRGLRNR